MPGDIDRESLTFVLRRQSHSFMNDLQVISGWLQLGNVQKALDHIEATKERVKTESLLMNSLGPGLYGWLRFLEFIVQANGGFAEVEVSPDADYGNWRSCRRFEETVVEIACYVARRGCTRLRMTISLERGVERVAIEPLDSSPGIDELMAEVAEKSSGDVTVRLDDTCGNPRVIVECPA